MKLGLIGYGKLGKAIEKIALEKGHTIIAKLTSKEGDFSDLCDADVCFECSEPSSVVKNIEKIAFLKKNVIVATTGWDERMSDIETIVANSNIGLLFSPNFSTGVYLFRLIVEMSAKMINPFTDYRVTGVETHHAAKRDSPSGTANGILKDLCSHFERKNAPSFSSIRRGDISGIHQIFFDSAVDSIELTHHAYNRDGFAKGAVEAAEWINGKKGFFTFNDFMKEKLSCASLEPLLP